jgi:hypothetical protein
MEGVTFDCMSSTWGEPTEDETSNHAPACLAPTEIESLRRDALKMDEVAKADFARRPDEDLWSGEEPAFVRQQS